MVENPGNRAPNCHAWFRPRRRCHHPDSPPSIRTCPVLRQLRLSNHSYLDSRLQNQKGREEKSHMAGHLQRLPRRPSMPRHRRRRLLGLPLQASCGNRLRPHWTIRRGQHPKSRCQGNRRT